jgi:hypothetical protein
MRKKFPKNRLVILSLFFFAFCISLFFLFVYPSSTIAQTSYQSINCPTPIPGKSTLQLVPCVPSGAVSQSPSFSSVTSVPAPTNSTPVTNVPVVQPNQSGSGQQSGSVCTPDSSIASGGSCSCQSDLEPDAICTVPSAATCDANGGITGPDLVLIGSGLGGAPMQPQPTSTNGSVQCLWLDTAPVPAAAQATSCSIECNSKPVLYFYSPTTKSINVKLDIPGFVTASIPHYPANGWQNVTVHPEGTPDGTLLYNNQSYKELYYEDETIKAQPPTQGFVIKTSDLDSSLRTYAEKLGLNTDEQNEFLAYWVPRLTALNAPYIFFTVFNQTQKEKVDHVIVSPAPTTTIAFLAYFKPLSSPITVAPLKFQSVPQRIGFTMVEWGGTIENE